VKNVLQQGFSDYITRYVSGHRKTAINVSR
jgi:hypothetical protein